MGAIVFLQEVDNPDLRDRGYIYWRLLSADPATAKVRACVAAERVAGLAEAAIINCEILLQFSSSFLANLS
jgi:vesicle coat complex subunit